MQNCNKGHFNEKIILKTHQRDPVDASVRILVKDAGARWNTKEVMKQRNVWDKDTNKLMFLYFISMHLI